MTIELTDDARGALERFRDVVAIALDGADYTPEDMAREVEEGRALCFTASDGVVVVKLHWNRRLEDNELEVWLAASTTNGAVETYLQSIEAIARDLGAVRVVFSSFRRGWLRMPGWKLRELTFERSLA